MARRNAPARRPAPARPPGPVAPAPEAAATPRATRGRRAAAAGGDAARRAPSRDRGRERFEALLDAAEVVIAEVGVEAATTNAIAARAGSGMGSLYHFFPNKDAIVEALSHRYASVMRGLTDYSRRPELRAMTLAGMAHDIVDPLVEFMRRTPAYRHVFHAMDRPGCAGTSSQELKDAVVDNVLAIIAGRAPDIAPARRRVLALVCVEMVHRLLDYAFEVPPAQRAGVITETKRLLALYAEMMENGDDPLVRLG